MILNKDETEICKLVSYYSIFSSLYLSTLNFLLFFTNIIYYVGNYKFGSVVLFILIAEVVKYFSSVLYIDAKDVNLSKKHGGKSIAGIFLNHFNKAKIKDGVKSVVVTSIVSCVYYGLAVLYGAEVFRKHEETFMFSSLLAVLTVFPVCVNLGPQSVVSIILGNGPSNKLEELLYQNYYLTLFGAWLGAFVIPLDWDRPWQVWPIPCSLGALLGCTVSHYIKLIEMQIGFRKKNKKFSIFKSNFWQ